MNHILVLVLQNVLFIQIISHNLPKLGLKSRLAHIISVTRVVQRIMELTQYHDYMENIHNEI